MAGNKEAIEMAYASVNAVRKEDIKKEEHQKIISSALSDVWSYSGLFEKETEDLRETRLGLDGPENGEAGELSGHFIKLYPELKKLSAWEVIFTMYNKLKGLNSLYTEISNKKENQEGERNMVGTQVIPDLEELSKKIEDEGVDKFINNNSNVAETDDESTKAQKEASKENIEHTKDNRIAFSTNAKIEKVVVAPPSAVDVCVGGMEAKGVLFDPQKAMETFIKKTGLIENEDGKISFTKVPNSPIDREAALKMYQEIKQAIADPTKEFEIHFSKSLGTVKGFIWLDNTKDAAPSPKTSNEMKTIMLGYSCGFLNFSGKDVQIHTKKVNRKNKGSAEKGSGTNKTEEKIERNKNREGVVTISFTDRATAFDKYGIYHKDIVKGEEEIRGGLKTEMSCVYLRDPKNGETESKRSIFRLPLKVKQYKLEVRDNDLLYFGTGEGINKKLEMIDVHNEQALKKQLNELAELAALAASQGLGEEGSPLAEIRKRASAIDAETVQKEVENVGPIVM